mmetsp:Transcript_14483/g.26230  ORF Transcript_14483/g.26230 Transcript_14483/m.26230 type:complete len:284 (-) Transcript_14483:2140-2991(-)
MASTFTACSELYLKALRERDQVAFNEAWHPKGICLALSSDGSVSKQGAQSIALSLSSLADEPPAIVAASNHGRILSITTISDTCACVKIQLANSPRTVTEFLTMLKDEGLWKIVSAVQSITLHCVPLQKSAPSDFTEVSTAIWDGYIRAGRACDSEAMGKIFHPHCRLTESSKGSVTIIDSNQFCDMVGNRWFMESHKPFVHLKNDSRISAADTLISIDFAGKDVAMVTLKIGYPPFLYHDVLLLLRISKPVAERQGSSPGWWIVAKSSDHEQWMENEKRETS